MKLGVIGAGSWGTALAAASSMAGSEVVLWSRHEEIVSDINNNHCNSKYLPDIKLQ